MGGIVKLPNCREVSPELLRAISRRTKNASYLAQYWSTYWSVVKILIREMDPKVVDERALDDVWLRVLEWLYDRNRAAIKTRGF